VLSLTPWKGEDVKQVFGCAPHAEARLGRDHRRAEVEAARAGRHIAALDSDQSSERLDEELFWKRGHVHDRRRHVQAARVGIRAKQRDPIVAVAERFQSLEDLLSVVQPDGARVKLEHMQGLDARVTPFTAVVVDQEHVRAEHPPELETGRVQIEVGLARHRRIADRECGSGVLFQHDVGSYPRHRSGSPRPFPLTLHPCKSAPTRYPRPSAIRVRL
jgi:hypothetical protein